MNRRNKEFAEEVHNLLLDIRSYADSQAYKNHVSPYDIEIEVQWLLEYHMTNRMIATEMCARRHYDNLRNRGLFKYCGDHDNEKIKLNPEFADKEIDLLIAHVRMPKNEVVG